VPILEKENFIKHFIGQPGYQTKLVKSALEVSESSARQFSSDDEGLSTLLREISSAEYIVTKLSRKAMEEMLNGIYKDGFLFKDFEEHIEPLCELSQKLQRVSGLADSLADMTKEEFIDVARALMIDLPKRAN
jgi:hypothetical protein